MWKFWKKKTDEEDAEVLGEQTEELNEGQTEDSLMDEEQETNGSSDDAKANDEGLADEDEEGASEELAVENQGQKETKSFWSFMGFGGKEVNAEKEAIDPEKAQEENDEESEDEDPEDEEPEDIEPKAEEADEEEPKAEDSEDNEPEEKEPEELIEKKGFFARLRDGLAKTRNNIVKGIDRLFSGMSIDDDFYEELEEILIMGDIGVNATTAIIEKLKTQVKEQHIKEPKECKELLIADIREQMEVGETAYEFETKQSIIMVIGVNGVGKTTTVGKLAWKLKDEGKKVLIAAADTFRAAAGDQLAQWASRAGVPMIGGKEGADPASVVFDAVSAAKARGIDILLIDTAGRLHNKKNLMEELRKMNRIVDKEFPNAHRENLIVLDGTTGQNALVQAREFGDVTNLTGIVLTKMDGTAKGGIAVAIQSELQIPVKYIGVGETTQDLQKFDPDDFVRALFDVDLSDDLKAEGPQESSEAE